MFDSFEPWQLIAILAVAVIVITILFGCFMDKSVNEMFDKFGSQKPDEHEEFPGI